MARVLVTGMSGAGKSTVLLELRRRGHMTVVSRRTNNPYGRSPEQAAEIAAYVESVEPLLRRGATLEIDGRRPAGDLADAIEELLTRTP